MSNLSRRQTLFITPFAVILLAGLAAGTIYYRAHQPSHIIRQALRSTLSNQKQAQVQIDETINAKPVAQAIKVTRKGSQNTQGAFDVQVAIATPATTFHAQSPDGKKLYINGAGLSNLPGLFQPAGDTSLAALSHAKTDQWYEIDHNFLSVLPVDPLHFLQLRLGADDAKKFDDTYRTHAFIQPEKTLAETSVGNELSHHYAVKLDPQKLSAFIKAYAATKPKDPSMGAALQAIRPSSQLWDLSIGTKSQNITQAILPASANAPLSSRTIPQAAAPLAVTAPPAIKSLPQLQSEYEAEVAAAAAAAKAKTTKSSSSSGVSSSAGFDTWAQEYNFSNYILPNLWR